MKAEIVAVGTELLLGQIANTNAAVISSDLADAGVNVYWHTVVGDNAERLVDTLRTAAARSDVVLITGGLGPTPDDLTREAVGEAFGLELERHDDLARKITAVFDRLGRVMPAENLKQADLPAGATPIPPEGTAPGFHLEVAGTLLVAMPGVPWEMKAMMESSVMPLLRERVGTATLVSREVLVVGLGESATYERIAELVDTQSNPTVAFRAGFGQVRVRITAKANDEDAARALIEPLEKEIRALLGRHAVPGEGTLAQIVGDMLRDRKACVGCAESLTGGLLASALSEAAGASDFFLGSIVSYSNEAKAGLVGVPESLLAEHGAVSEEAARAMAEGAAERFSSELALSTTGVAGPVEQEGKPVGTIYVGACWRGRTEVRQVTGYGDREHIKSIAVTSALDLARRMLEDE